MQFQDHQLDSDQTHKVEQFILITEADENAAIFCLKSNDWEMELALDRFVQTPEFYLCNWKDAVYRQKAEDFYAKYRCEKWLLT